MSLPTQRNVAVDPFTFVQREFGPVLGRLLNDGRPTGGRLAGYFAAPAYPVDVREDADHLYVEADLPGFRKEDVQITVEDQTLTLIAERKVDPEAAVKAGEYLLNERRQARFERTFKLPLNVSDQDVTASLEHGVLTVTLAKREESKPRKIVVQ